MEEKSPNYTNYIIVGLMLAAAFLGGRFSANLGQEAVESGSRPTAQPTQAADSQQNQPQVEKPTVLGEAERAKILADPAGAKGNPEAPITIVEFSEYECPYCQRYVSEAYEQIFEEYSDRVYYVFRDFPLPFHSHAQQLAEAARCAGDQNAYWEMHDLIFAERDDWVGSEDAGDWLASVMAKLGLDASAFQTCLDSGKYVQAVEDDIALGKSVGISGTPSFFINGQMLVGAQPFTAFQSIIDKELEK